MKNQMCEFHIYKYSVLFLFTTVYNLSIFDFAGGLMVCAYGRFSALVSLNQGNLKLAFR